jgi:hypothetical protein
MLTSGGCGCWMGCVGCGVHVCSQQRSCATAAPVPAQHDSLRCCACNDCPICMHVAASTAECSGVPSKTASRGRCLPAYIRWMKCGHIWSAGAAGEREIAWSATALGCRQGLADRGTSGMRPVTTCTVAGEARCGLSMGEWCLHAGDVESGHQASEAAWQQLPQDQPC